MVLSGTLFGAGDVLAQLLFIDGNYDYLRTVRNAAYGGLLFAPIASKLYRGLNDHARFPSWALRRFAPPTSATRKTLDTVVRVAVDQLCWAPVGIALYFSAMGVLEGASADEIALRLREGWAETLWTNWRVWPWLQLANFRLVPVAYRLAVVNVASVLWNTFLSYENWRAGQSVHQIEAEEQEAAAAATNDGRWAG